MNEIVFVKVNAWNAIKSDLLLYLLLSIAPLIVKLIDYLINRNNTNMHKFFRLYPAYFVLITLFILKPALPRIEYAIDYISDNKSITNIRMDKLSSNNTGYFYIDENQKYAFGHNREQISNLEKYFVGYMCEIEYYKSSGSVIRIKVLE